MGEDRPADYDKHTDEELRDAVERAQQQDERLAEENSDAALEAERAQRDEMEQELSERDTGG